MSVAQSVQESPRLPKQFFKFASVGVLSTLLDSGLLFLMYTARFPDGDYLSVRIGQWMISHDWVFFAMPVNGSTGQWIQVNREASIPVIQTLSGIASIALSFNLNRSWTFDIKSRENRRVHLAKFVLVYGLTLILHTAFVTSVAHFLPLVVTKFIAIIFTAVMTFTGQKLWVFKKGGT